MQSKRKQQKKINLEIKIEPTPSLALIHADYDREIFYTELRNNYRQQREKREPLEQKEMKLEAERNSSLQLLHEECPEDVKDDNILKSSYLRDKDTLTLFNSSIEIKKTEGWFSNFNKFFQKNHRQKILEKIKKLECIIKAKEIIIKHNENKTSINQINEDMMPTIKSIKDELNFIKSEVKMHKKMCIKYQKASLSKELYTAYIHYMRQLKKTQSLSLIDEKNSNNLPESKFDFIQLKKEKEKLSQSQNSLLQLLSIEAKEKNNPIAIEIKYFVDFFVALHHEISEIFTDEIITSAFEVANPKFFAAKHKHPPLPRKIDVYLPTAHRTEFFRFHPIITIDGRPKIRSSSHNPNASSG